MPREATGELRPVADGFAARITIEGRRRQDFFLPTCATEAEAEARCRGLAGIAARLRQAGKASEIVSYLEMGAKARAGRPWETILAVVADECAGKLRGAQALAPTTFEAWAKDWTSGELARKHPDHVREKSSAGRDEELLRLYILPHVRDVLVSEFALAHAELVMASMPSADPRRPDKPLRPGTRRHVAQVMARLMRLAVYPGKLRTSSPIPPGWLPRSGEPLAKECLYPDEDALLLCGKSVERDHWGRAKQDVPVLRRLAYGFLAREGMRTSEMAGLRWRDVDLERGRVSLDQNKTDDPRDWDLRPDVVEALARWKATQTETEADDHVFAEDGIPLNVMHLAALLQSDLRRVGVSRPQLFERSKVRRPIRAHDLRATFVTISLATGKTETWISDRTGHRSHEMIEAYRRKARTWNLGELGPLHELIPELREAGPAVRLPHGLPHAWQIPENSQRAQRKPMP